MYSSYGSRSASALSTGNAVWIIISAVVAVIGGIVLYFTFLNKSNDGKYTKFLGWMYDFLTFKKMCIEHVLKILYLILAIFITLGSFALISSSFVAFLATLVIGNIVARLTYELMLLALVICRNTTEINEKLGGGSKKAESKPAAKVEVKAEPKTESKVEESK